MNSPLFIVSSYPSQQVSGLNTQKIDHMQLNVIIWHLQTLKEGKGAESNSAPFNNHAQ